MNRPQLKVWKSNDILPWSAALKATGEYNNLYWIESTEQYVVANKETKVISYTSYSYFFAVRNFQESNQD